MDYRILHSSPFFLSGILIFIIALIAIIRAKTRGALYLFFVCISATIWAITEGMLYLNYGIETNISIINLQYIGIVSLLPFSLLFVLSIFSLENWINRTTKSCLFLMALTVIIFVWTNGYHHLVFSEYYTIDITNYSMIGVNHGPLWWVFIIYHYCLILILSIILLVQIFIASGYQKSQAKIILVALAFVWLANIVYVSGNSPIANMDITPIAFVIVSGSMAWAFFRYRLLNIIPIARAKIFQVLDDIVFVTDNNNRILDINPSAEKLFQVDSSEIAGKKLSQIVVEEHQDLMDLEEEKISEICLELNGESHYYNVVISKIHDKHRLDYGKVIVLRDITEYKNAEEEIRNNENNYSIIFESANDAIFIHDINSGNILDINKKVLDMYKFNEKKDIINQSVENISSGIAPYRGIDAFNLIGKAIQGQPQLFEWHAKDSKGNLFWVEVNLKKISLSGNDRILAIVRDITRRKIADESLRESESFLKSIFDAIQDGISVLDKDFNIIRVNNWMENMYTDDLPLVGKCHQKFQKRSSPCPWCPALKTIETGEPQSAIVPFPSDENPTRWFGLSTFPLKDNEKNVIGIIEYIKDITKQKNAEEALQQSEERYRSLVENTMDGYFICEMPSGCFIFLNQRICDLSGYSMQEGMNLTIWDVVDPEEHSIIAERITARMQGKVHKYASNIYGAVRKDGSKYRAEVSTSLVIYKGKPAMQGVLRDVTEKEKLQLQFQQAQKMESIGTLAGGIAHNFNNVLMGIQGRASLMMMDRDPSSPDHEHLRSIGEYVASATELTRALLGFARGGKYEVKTTDLNELIQHENQLFGQTKKEIRIQGAYQDGLWAVEVDQDQIRQVLLNLYVNAWQAMPSGGDLFIRTENVTPAEETGKPPESGIAPGKYVKLSVTDTGVGMEQETLKKIFDPFFSTKDKGQGSGLGLASVYGIIKNHGGFILVDSEKDKGTTFSIYLPASDKRPVETKRDSEQQEIKYGQGTVLLVDDEETIVDVGRQMLEKLGYRTLIARSGLEALDLYEKRKTEIDLVILDMIMPGVGGGETYDRMKELDDSVKVLLSSGYSINGQAQEILNRGCRGFIQKPFSLNDLSFKIKDVLG